MIHLAARRTLLAWPVAFSEIVIEHASFIRFCFALSTAAKAASPRLRSFYLRSRAGADQISKNHRACYALSGSRPVRAGLRACGEGRRRWPGKFTKTRPELFRAPPKVNWRLRVGLDTDLRSISRMAKSLRYSLSAGNLIRERQSSASIPSSQRVLPRRRNHQTVKDRIGDCYPFTS